MSDEDINQLVSIFKYCLRDKLLEEYDEEDDELQSNTYTYEYIYNTVSSLCNRTEFGTHLFSLFPTFILNSEQHTFIAKHIHLSYHT